MLRYGSRSIKGPPIRSIGAIAKMTGVNYKSISGILLRFQRNNNRCILGRRRNGIRFVFTEEQEAFLLDLNALRSFGIRQRCAFFRA